MLGRDNAKGSDLTAARPSAKVWLAVYLEVRMCRANQTESTGTNQDGDWTCVEPEDLPGSKTTVQNPRCSIEESVDSPSHF